MTTSEFEYLVKILRMVHSGRSETARTFLAQLEPIEREDWQTLITTFLRLLEQ